VIGLLLLIIIVGLLVMRQRRQHSQEQQSGNLLVPSSSESSVHDAQDYHSENHSENHSHHDVGDGAESVASHTRSQFSLELAQPQADFTWDVSPQSIDLHGQRPQSLQM
jgi:ABC-type nickel/cobalt efflux system permease component RcnA